MNPVKKHIVLLLFTCFAVMPGTLLFAQKNLSESQLKKKREKLEAEIKYTNKLLSEVKKDKKTTLYQLNLLNKRINRRYDLIATLKREIYLLDQKIAQTDNALKKLSNDIDVLKKEYAKIAYALYRNNSGYNKLIFLFSAEDLNQAYQRLRYMEQLSVYVKKQAEELKAKEKEKSARLAQLNREKKTKKELLDKKSEEIARLEMEQQQKEATKRTLQGKEKKLRAQLRAKQQEAKKLTRQIEQTIANETKPVTKKGKTVTYALTPEERKLSASFVANKGKLPWPLEKGVISETYGIHKHPVLKHVQIKNNGINIATSKGASARAVFKGKVVSVARITNTNRAVIIKHGEYFTVYSNLEKVYVKPGQMVNTKDKLGMVHTDLDGKTELNFQVWKGKKTQNPAYWISRR